MLYLSGVHALNIPCELETCGDWHQSALRWRDLTIYESQDSAFGDYGIEKDKSIPEHPELYNVANHIRALLDLLEHGNFAVAQGMRDDFICNDKYTEEIFNKVSLLKNTDNWNKIDHFMGKEYFMQWVRYKENNREWRLSDMKRLSAADVVRLSNQEDKELLFGQFLDDFYHAEDKHKLIEDEPPHNDVEQWFVCFLAGSVHKLANDFHLPIPSWVFDERYIYDGVYYAFDTKNPEFQEYLETNTPKEYKQRNIMVGDNSLERV